MTLFQRVISVFEYSRNMPIIVFCFASGNLFCGRVTPLPPLGFSIDDLVFVKIINGLSIDVLVV